MSAINEAWSYRLLQLADHIASWSKDPSTKVGAVIVDRHRRVLGVGFNGFARGVRDLPDRLIDRELKYKLVVHAEANAILNSTASIRDAFMFVTHWPCTSCTGLLIQSGIRDVVCYEYTQDYYERWSKDIAITNDMFAEVGGSVTAYRRPK